MYWQKAAFISALFLSRANGFSPTNFNIQGATTTSRRMTTEATTNTEFRSPSQSEQEFLISQAAATEPWNEGEAEELLGGILSEYFSGALPEGHTVMVWDGQDDGVVGWSYYAPTMHSEGVWDVWWIGIASEAHSKGFGTKLLSAIESDIKSKGGRLVVIETSSTEQLKKARSFYPKMGYKNCGQIPDFYGDGDDKVIFSKSLKEAKRNSD